MQSSFKWTAAFLVHTVPRVVVPSEESYLYRSILASKLAWAIGTTFGIAYDKRSCVRDDCRYLAAFIVEGLEAE